MAWHNGLENYMQALIDAKKQGNSVVNSQGMDTEDSDVQALFVIDRNGQEEPPSNANISGMNFDDFVDKKEQRASNTDSSKIAPNNPCVKSLPIMDRNGQGKSSNKKSSEMDPSSKKEQIEVNTSSSGIDSNYPCVQPQVAIDRNGQEEPFNEKSSGINDIEDYLDSIYHQLCFHVPFMRLLQVSDRCGPFQFGTLKDMEKALEGDKRFVIDKTGSIEYVQLQNSRPIDISSFGESSGVSSAKRSMLTDREEQGESNENSSGSNDPIVRTPVDIAGNGQEEPSNENSSGITTAKQYLNQVYQYLRRDLPFIRLCAIPHKFGAFEKGKKKRTLLKAIKTDSRFTLQTVNGQECVRLKCDGPLDLEKNMKKFSKAELSRYLDKVYYHLCHNEPSFNMVDLRKKIGKWNNLPGKQTITSMRKAFENDKRFTVQGKPHCPVIGSRKEEFKIGIQSYLEKIYRHLIESRQTMMIFDVKRKFEREMPLNNLRELLQNDSQNRFLLDVTVFDSVRARPESDMDDEGQRWGITTRNMSRVLEPEKRKLLIGLESDLEEEPISGLESDPDDDAMDRAIVRTAAKKPFMEYYLSKVHDHLSKTRETMVISDVVKQFKPKGGARNLRRHMINDSQNRFLVDVAGFNSVRANSESEFDDEGITTRGISSGRETKKSGPLVGRENTPNAEENTRKAKKQKKEQTPTVAQSESQARETPRNEAEDETKVEGKRSIKAEAKIEIFEF